MAKKTSSLRDKIRKNSREQQGSSNFSVLRMPEGIKKMETKKPGAYTMNIVPYLVTEQKHPDGIEKGEMWYKRPYWVHRNVGVDNKTVVCLKSIGKPCPICKMYAKLKNDVDADEAEAKAIKPSLRVMYNVMNKDGEIELLDLSAFALQEMLDEEIMNGEEEWAGFADLTGGYALRVRMKEESMGKAKFNKASRIDFVEREDVDESILESTIDPSGCLITMTGEQLSRLMEGEEPEEDEPAADAGEDEEDESPRKPVRKPVAKPAAKRAAPAEDEDEEEEAPPARKPVAKKRPPVEEDEDTEEEEEAPKPKAKRPPPKPTEDEEDDIPFEEEEEEEAPVRKKAAAKKPPVEEDEEEEEEAPAPKRTVAKKKPPVEEDEEEEEEAPKPKKKFPAVDATGRNSGRKAEAPAKKASSGCPHGGTFGKDCDTLDECSTCEKWGDCVDAQP